MPTDTAITINEAATRLSVSRRTIDHLIKTGRLRSIKIGEGRQGARRIRESDLAAFMDEATS
jgi:excisionase family DNA binding protein